MKNLILVILSVSFFITTTSAQKDNMQFYRDAYKAASTTANQQSGSTKTSSQTQPTCNVSSPSDKICSYVSSTGKTTCPDVDDKKGVNSTGYSGYGEAKNNPSMSSLKDRGPIPSGTYDILGCSKTKRGDPTIDLITATDYCPSRTGFEIHADNQNHLGQSSTGCIISDPLSRQTICNNGYTQIVVSDYPAIPTNITNQTVEGFLASIKTIAVQSTQQTPSTMPVVRRQMTLRTSTPNNSNYSQNSSNILTNHNYFKVDLPNTYVITDGQIRDISVPSANSTKEYTDHWFEENSLKEPTFSASHYQEPKIGGDMHFKEADFSTPSQSEKSNNDGDNDDDGGDDD